jgi:hypothetical protein
MPKPYDPQPDLRRQWRRYCKRIDAYYIRLSVWDEAGGQGLPPESIPFPEELHDLRCGARTKTTVDHGPCKRRDLYHSGRCPLHGGCSTGPTTPEGKAKVYQNLKSVRTRGK